MVTVIVGVILVLLLLNEGGDFNFLTGSSSVDLDGGEKESLLEEKKIDFKLDFNAVPKIREITKTAKIDLIFDKPTNKIKVNEEELELNNLERIEMVLEGFEGEIIFDETTISLKGEASKISLNGIDISSQRKQMKIVLNDLIYNMLDLQGVSFKEVTLPSGEGELKLGEKMKYSLEKEAVKVEGFEGEIKINEEKTSLMTMEGKVAKFSTEGEFNLNFG